MEMILMLVMGGLVWIAVWTIYVLLQTLIYGALTCATGFSGAYIGTCVQSPELFQIADVAISSSGVVAFLLLVATFKFMSRFWNEAAVAFPRIVHPFSSPG